MANNKISGIYELITRSSIATYSLANAGRNTNISINSTDLKWVDVSNGDEQIPDINGISLLSKNRLHLKKIKIIPLGAKGLRTTGTAASFVIDYRNINGSHVESGPVIDVIKFDEWQNVDIYLEPYKYIKENFYRLGIYFGAISIDDYNIQDSYIGQDVNFKLEIEIQTAGIRREKII